MFEDIVLRLFYLHGTIKLISFTVGNLSSDGSIAIDKAIKPAKTNIILIIINTPLITLLF